MGVKRFSFLMVLDFIFCGLRTFLLVWGIVCMRDDILVKPEPKTL